MGTKARISTLAVLGATLALLAVVSVASASHSWGSYHWARTSNPFTLQLGDNVSSAWDGHLTASAADWTASTVLDTSVVAGSGGKTCKASAGTVQVCNGKYGRNGWLGIAEIWISGGHITQGRVRMNDTYFSTSTYNNANAKRHVMCQEIGHTLGLDHQRSATSYSCMDDVNGLFNAAFVSPNAHDYEQLGLIYAHLDGTTTVKQSAAAAAQGAADDGDGIGTPRRSGKERSTLVVRDLGGGRKVAGWVTWADGE